MERERGDLAILALTAEVERRRRAGAYGYDYGKLVADTTEAERRAIVEDYRKRGGRKRAAFVAADDERDVRQLMERAAGGQE